MAHKYALFYEDRELKDAIVLEKLDDKKVEMDLRLKDEVPKG